MSEILVVDTRAHHRQTSMCLVAPADLPCEALPLDVSNRLIDGDPPLRAWRKYRGYSKIELSVSAEVKFSQVVGIENCTSTGSDEALRRLAEVLDIDVTQLK